MVRQVAVDVRLVGVMQHIHHMRAADTFGIVEAGILEAARFEIGDAALGVLLHVLFGAEHDRLRGACFGTSRSLPYRHAIRTQRAFVGLMIFLRDARDVERAAFDAIAAADAVLVDEIDDAVRILHDGAGRRTGLQTSRIGAMHAAVLADQPFEIVGFRVHPFGETHQGEHVRRQIVRIHIDAVVLLDRGIGIVPLDAGRLAGLAADAFRHVDQLRHRRELTLRRRKLGCGRAADHVPLAQIYGELLRRRIARCGVGVVRIGIFQHVRPPAPMSARCSPGTP